MSERKEAGARGEFLDLEQWPRREHFELFRAFSQPFFNLTVEVPVTELWLMSREGGLSFAAASLFAAVRAANEVEALRLRIRGAGVWRHERISFTTTFPRPDGTFAFARLDYTEDFPGFQAQYRRERELVHRMEPLKVAPPDDDLIYHSSLPWLRFTAVSNPLHPEGDSVPRLVFGRCSREGEGWVLPVALEAHHALIDGADAARFYQSLERHLRELAALP